jgi:hypothetical protein
MHTHFVCLLFSALSVPTRRRPASPRSIRPAQHPNDNEYRVVPQTLVSFAAQDVNEGLDPES